MKELLDQIVHDIRSPAVCININASLVKDIFPKLVLTYREAQRNNLTIPTVNDKILDEVENIISIIESSSVKINDYLDKISQRGEKSE